jgi:hypothetical protein
MSDQYGRGSAAETPEMRHAGVVGIRLAVALAMSFFGVVSVVGGPPHTTIADPSDDPCPLAMAIVCRFLPIAPGLDDDVDLTKQPPGDPATPDPQPSSDPAVPAPTPQRTADICSNGCI